MESEKNINESKEERKMNSLIERIEKQEEKLDKIYVSVEKTRKYFVSMLIITIVMIALPLLGFLI